MIGGYSIPYYGTYRRTFQGFSAALTTKTSSKIYKLYNKYYGRADAGDLLLQAAFTRGNWGNWETSYLAFDFRPEVDFTAMGYTDEETSDAVLRIEVIRKTLLAMNAFGYIHYLLHRHGERCSYKDWDKLVRDLDSAIA